jgi:hypothetical protein
MYSDTCITICNFHASIHRNSFRYLTNFALRILTSEVRGQILHNAFVVVMWSWRWSSDAKSRSPIKSATNTNYLKVPIISFSRFRIAASLILWVTTQTVGREAILGVGYKTTILRAYCTTYMFIFISSSYLLQWVMFLFCSCVYFRLQGPRIELLA